MERDNISPRINILSEDLLVKFTITLTKMWLCYSRLPPRCFGPPDIEKQTENRLGSQKLPASNRASSCFRLRDADDRSNLWSSQIRHFAVQFAAERDWLFACRYFLLINALILILLHSKSVAIWLGERARISDLPLHVSIASHTRNSSMYTVYRMFTSSQEAMSVSGTATTTTRRSSRAGVRFSLHLDSTP